MVVCIQCALKAFVEGTPTQVFQETMVEHMARYHPDLEQTRLERQDLERAAEEKIAMLRNHDHDL